MPNKSTHNPMSAYELMIKTNQYLLRGGELTDAHKRTIVRQLWEGRITDGRLRTFDPYAYPKYFIPPYNNGKRLQTLIPTSPKTNINADNAYEFEILRLLNMFDPNDEVAEMIEGTLKRLKKTCFGYQSCHYADCFEASLNVLRFLTFAKPDDKDWITKQINIYNNHFTDAPHHSGVQKYYWYILSEMSLDMAEPELIKQKDLIIDQLSRNIKIKNENDDIPIYAMRNALSRLPEYTYLKDRKPYEEKGRLYFSV